MTSDKMDVTQELAFIEYNGKNYLIETSFDYNYKKYNGINVVAFENGLIYEKVYLTMTADGYDVFINPLEDKYQALAKEASEITKEHYKIDKMDTKILIGDAETALVQSIHQHVCKMLLLQTKIRNLVGTLIF